MPLTADQLYVYNLTEPHMTSQAAQESPEEAEARSVNGYLYACSLEGVPKPERADVVSEINAPRAAV